MTWVEDRIYAAGGEHIPQTWADFARQTGIAADISTPMIATETSRATMA